MMLMLPQLVFDVRVAVLKLRRFTLAQLIQASDWPARAVEWQLGSLVRQGFVDPLPSDRWALSADRKRRAALQCSLMDWAGTGCFPAGRGHPGNPTLERDGD